MNRKNIAIEILPRALGVINLAVLFLGEYFTNWPPKLNENQIAIVLGSLIAAAGFVYWMAATYFMRHAFHTKELITNGPFKNVRHPMYVGAYGTMIGVGMIFFSWLWFAILAIFIPVWYLDCRIEEKQMTGIRGDEYLHYKTQSGMFLPRLRKG